MSFDVRATAGELVVRLRGIDRLLCWRREVTVPRAVITTVRRVDRAELEPLLDHRLYGVGRHRGDRQQGRRRVGAFMGRETPAGRQFWAVEKGHGAVLVVDADDGMWQRLVVAPARCTEDVLDMVE